MYATSSPVLYFNIPAVYVTGVWVIYVLLIRVNFEARALPWCGSIWQVFQVCKVDGQLGCPNTSQLPHFFFPGSTRKLELCLTFKLVGYEHHPCSPFHSFSANLHPVFNVDPVWSGSWSVILLHIVAFHLDSYGLRYSPDWLVSQMLTFLY